MPYFTELHKETKILFGVFCFLAVLYGLSFFIHNTGETRFISRLMLPQDIEAIQTIRFEIPLRSEPVEMGKMLIEKKGSRFFLHTSNGMYPIRDEIISRFFAVLTDEQTFTVVSKKVHHYHHYAITDETAARITCIRNDKTILADIFFGAADTLGTARYVRTGRSINVFRIDNGIESFLTLAHTFWLDLQVYKGLFEQNTIQSISSGRHFIIRTPKNTHLFENLELFLRQFSCIGVYNAPALQTTATEMLTFNLGSGEAVSLFCTPLETGDFVFFDSRSSHAYLLSGYTYTQLMERTAALVKPEASLEE